MHMSRWYNLTPVGFEVGTKMVSVGWYFFCAVSKSNDLVCWSLFNTGEQPFKEQKKLDDINKKNKYVTVGKNQFCVKNMFNIVDCYNNLGINNMQTPREILVGTKSISAGDGLICAVSQTNLVYCWDSSKLYINGVNNTNFNQGVPKRILAGTFFYCYLDDKLDLNCADYINMCKMRLEGYEFKDFGMSEPLICGVDK